MDNTTTNSLRRRTISSLESIVSAGGVQVELDAGGLERICLSYQGASMLVYLQGAHITEYTPAGSDNILWVSKSNAFQPGKSIRGGIPICWPWFGPHPEADRPQHGFARTALFELKESRSCEQYSSVVLRLDSTNVPFDEWRNRVELEIEIRLGDSLWMEMRTTNISDKAVELSTCLHNYFAVEDAQQIAIPKLLNKHYLDKTREYEKNKQTEPFLVEREVDRIYLDTLDEAENIELKDLLSDREIEIQTWGCEHLVIWNPWLEKASQMGDFDNDGYRNMICVEPATAPADLLPVTDSVSLAPGSTQRSGQRIKLIS